MRRLVVNTFLTLDGVMQAPGGPAEDESGMFELGGWSVKYWNEAMDRAMGETMSDPFDLVLGRRTYDIFASYWPSAPEEAGGKPLNDATKYVASRGRPTLAWAHSQLIEGDAAEGVAAARRSRTDPNCRCTGAPIFCRLSCGTGSWTSFGCGPSRSYWGPESGCSPTARFPRRLIWFAPRCSRRA